MRERFVTRTITSLTVGCLCVNKETAECYNDEFIVTGVDTANEKKVLSFIENQIPVGSPVKVVDVVNVTRNIKLYRLPESLFIEYANAYEEAEANLVRNEE